MNDVGKNAPEDTATLLHQQNELMDGERFVQMFPTGTGEIPMLVGTERYVNDRGIFHYWPNKISKEEIEHLSSQGQENLMLRLGPYSKVDIAKRLENGEKLVFITEYSPMNVEIRSAAGTEQTCAEQLAYFEHTMHPGNHIEVGLPPARVQDRKSVV